MYLFHKRCDKEKDIITSLHKFGKILCYVYLGELICINPKNSGTMYCQQDHRA